MCFGGSFHVYCRSSGKDIGNSGKENAFGFSLSLFVRIKSANSTEKMALSWFSRNNRERFCCLNQILFPCSGSLVNRRETRNFLPLICNRIFQCYFISKSNPAVFQGCRGAFPARMRMIFGKPGMELEAEIMGAVRTRGKCIFAFQIGWQCICVPFLWRSRKENGNL